MSAADRTQARAAMAVCGLMTAHLVAAKACRDAIFLSQFRTSDLPAMVAAAAIVSIVVSVLGSRLQVRLGPHRVTPVLCALSGVLQIGEWALLGHYPRVAAAIIYLHVVALGAVLISGFWTLMNEAFEPRSAKQLFGRISGTGTLGGLMGGLVAERVAAWFGASDVVLLLALLHLACAALLWSAARPPELRPAGEHRETRPIDAVHRYPFLLTLTGLVILASSGAGLLDFVFKAHAAQTIGRGAPLLRFFSLYYTGTSLLTFLIQTLLMRSFVQRAGLAAAASTSAGAISIGSLMALLIPGFPMLTAVRGMEVVMRGSLYRSAYELFYTAIAPADKRAVKSLIDVGAERAGDAVGSAGVSLMLVLAPGRFGPILVLACGMSVLALMVASRLQRGYLQALEKSLVERAIELDPSMAEDSVTHSILMDSIRLISPISSQPAVHASAAPTAAITDPFLARVADLRSGDASRVIRAAKSIGPDDFALAPLAIDLLAWDEVMPAARDALERMGPKITGMLVDVLLDSEHDFVVRRRLPRVLAYLPSPRSVEALYEALSDQRFEVRFYSGRALYLLLRDHPDLSLAPERVWAAINRELSQQRSVWNGHRLLDSRTSDEKEWFFDDQLLDRADRNLEHLFTLLALLLPMDAVRIAFRALHTEDRQLKGTAFEYLESATPADTRQMLLPLLEADAEHRSRAPRSDRALERLMASGARVNQSLKLDRLHMEARTRPPSKHSPRSDFDRSRREAGWRSCWRTSWI